MVYVNCPWSLIRICIFRIQRSTLITEHREPIVNMNSKVKTIRIVLWKPDGVAKVGEWKWVAPASCSWHPSSQNCSLAFEQAWTAVSVYSRAVKGGTSLLKSQTHPLKLWVTTTQHHFDWAFTKNALRFNLRAINILPQLHNPHSWQP